MRAFLIDAVSIINIIKSFIFNTPWRSNRRFSAIAE
jgi:hypothetical protein